MKSIKNYYRESKEIINRYQESKDEIDLTLTEREIATDISELISEGIASLDRNKFFENINDKDLPSLDMTDEKHREILDALYDIAHGKDNPSVQEYIDQKTKTLTVISETIMGAVEEHYSKDVYDYNGNNNEKLRASRTDNLIITGYMENLIDGDLPEKLIPIRDKLEEIINKLGIGVEPENQLKTESDITARFEDICSAVVILKEAGAVIVEEKMADVLATIKDTFNRIEIDGEKLTDIIDTAVNKAKEFCQEAELGNIPELEKLEKFFEKENTEDLTTEQPEINNDETIIVEELD